jgi:uncharacterized membrane protein
MWIFTSFTDMFFSLVFIALLILIIAWSIKTVFNDKSEPNLFLALVSLALLNLLFGKRDT